MLLFEPWDNDVCLMAVAFLLRYERSMDATNGALRHRSWFQGFGIFDTEGYGVFMLSFETHEAGRAGADDPGLTSSKNAS